LPPRFDVAYALSTLTSGESWSVGSVKADCSNALSTWPFVAVNGSWFALVSIVPADTSLKVEPWRAS
jgi:hypothetical protein